MVNQITYELYNGEYAFIVEYKSHRDCIYFKSGDHFIGISLSSLKPLIKSLMEIERTIEASTANVFKH